MINYRVEKGKIPVIFYKNNTNFVDMSILYKTGSLNEDLDSFGVAHFLEHMFFKGTEKYSKKTLLKDMVKYGEFNAETMYTYTSYYFNCIKQNFRKCYDMLVSMMNEPLFSEEEIEPEKEVVLEEFYMYENDQSATFSNIVLNKAFGEGMHDIIGGADYIKSFDKEKLIRYRNKFYNNKNVYVIISGDLDFNEVLNLVDNTLNYPSDPVCENAIITKVSEYGTEFSFDTDFEQSIFGILFPWSSVNEFTLSSYFSKCMNYINYEILRDEMGLCYGVSGHLFGDYNSRHALYTMLTNASKLEKAKEGFLSIIDSVKKNGFNEEIRDVVYNQSLYGYEKTLEDSSSMVNFIAKKIIEAKDISIIDQVNSKFFDRNAINSITNNDLIDYANKYFDKYEIFNMVEKKD